MRSRRPLGARKSPALRRAPSPSLRLVFQIRPAEKSAITVGVAVSKPRATSESSPQPKPFANPFGPVRHAALSSLDEHAQPIMGDSRRTVCAEAATSRTVQIAPREADGFKQTPQSHSRGVCFTTTMERGIIVVFVVPKSGVARPNRECSVTVAAIDRGSGRNRKGICGVAFCAAFRIAGICVPAHRLLPVPWSAPRISVTANVSWRDRAFSPTQRLC